MNFALGWRCRQLAWSAFLGVIGGFAAAQDTAPAKPAPVSSALQDAGEPRANATPETQGNRPSAAASSAAAPAGRKTVAGRTGAAGSKPGATDRVDLGTATVTGDQEQPKVMYIVPWKRSDIGDLSGKPMNSLLDEALAPVDRDEFKREVAYYGAVRSDASQNGASHAAQGEK